MRPATHLFFALVAACGLFGGCDAPVTVSPTSPTADGKPEAQLSQAPALRQRQMAFLDRIRAADPQGTTIERALLNEQNELGLILNRSVPLDKIPALMRSVMTQMAKEFPGQDLTVLAYTPSNPPHKIGTARLDGRTSDVTYTPVR